MCAPLHSLRPIRADVLDMVQRAWGWPDFFRRAIPMSFEVKDDRYLISVKSANPTEWRVPVPVPGAGVGC